MGLKKHIPNSITCLNLFSGILATISAYEADYKLTLLFVLLSAVFDFFDGLSARWLKAYSPMGKELDSLADVVSFGMYVRYNDKTIRIVGVDEADASKGLISFLSPIAKSLIGKRKGDVFEIKVPKGTEIVEVKEVNSQPTLTTNQHEITRMIGVKSVQISGQTSTTNQRKSTQIVSVTSESMCESYKDKGQKINDKISQVTQNDSTEFLPIVNERGNIVGRALHLEIHNGNKLLHPAVHLLVYNSNKEIVAEYNWHVAFGETPEKTLKRKLKESESLVETYGRMSENIKPKFKKQYIREDKNEKELVTVFVVNL